MAEATDGAAIWSRPDAVRQSDPVIAADRLARTSRAPRGARPMPIVPLSVATNAMGGRLSVHLAAAADDECARQDAQRLLSRIGRWADRLSRHLERSDLSALNADPRSSVPVGPTLGAVLWAGLEAADESDGLVDITLLDARLAAEVSPSSVPTTPGPRTWSLATGPRRTAVVHRPPGVRFDLGGVAKGWLADRGLELLSSWPSAVVDADGDLAVRCAPGQLWAVAVDDPRTDGAALTILHLSAPLTGWPVRWGVATSGTSVHRWRHGESVRHHLIDPRTGAPALTDVVQATVVCGSALRAEALAKAAVIAGAVDGLALLERAGVRGAVILTQHDETLALPQTLTLLAE
jgi:thiamine biosynthesis lipoprotein